MRPVVVVAAALLALTGAPAGAGAQGAGSSSATTAPTTATWTTNLVGQRGRIGWTGAFACPANGTAGNVWGSAVYTDDSSICTAAVHAGVITLAGGGTVRVGVQAGEQSYAASTQNGISTGAYGSWSGSFVVLGGPSSRASPTRVAPATAHKATWTDTATGLRGQNGTRVTYVCPPNGTLGSVWGAGAFTDDSSICTAAVHEGKITRATGGRVTIEIAPGLTAYRGTIAHGVASKSYGTWSGSFVFR